jgi:rhodanese-related sulfurtransferase
MKARHYLAIVFITLGIVIAAIPQNTTHPYKLAPGELLEQANSGIQYFSPDQIADMIINGDPSILLIDVRAQDAFEKYHLPGAINIPLSDLLSDQWRDYLDQDFRQNVFYSNGTVMANQAWMITMQLGYENNYVMQGGLNYWVETIMNPEAPPSTSPNEEIAKYNFRQGAGMQLGGSAAVSEESASLTSPSLPKITPRPKKKRAQGGC